MSTVPPNQEQLFTVSEHTGRMHIPDVQHPGDGPAVDIISQKLHLMDALTHLAGASMRAGLMEAGEEVVAAHYGDAAAPEVLSRVEARRVVLIGQAKRAFAAATGHYALVDGGVPEIEAKRLTRGMFSDFLKQYYGARHHKASFEFRKQLEAQVDEWTEAPEETVSAFNRANGLRPHSRRDNTDLQEAFDTGELQDLDTRERLLAIAADPRAGFFPTTNSEKNRVLSWLDYLDNPEKPLGIVHQLREVHARSQNWSISKKAPSSEPGVKKYNPGVKGGIRAVESIAWEEGDALLETVRRLIATHNLKTAIDQDQRPTITLFDEFAATVHDGATLQDQLGEHWAGLAAYVQYKDIVEFVNTGRIKAFNRDPLRGTQVPPKSERPDFDTAPGKRKTELNQYTRADVTDAYKAHIIDRLRNITIGEARRDIGDFMRNLERQKSFHQRRLEDLTTFSSPRDTQIHDALFTILDKLHLTAA